MSLPSADIWSLFPALAVVVLTMAVIFMALSILWSKFNAWTIMQNQERVAERERQREWEEQQDKNRDERWQAFIREERIQRERENQADRAQLAQMADLIDKLSSNTKSMTDAVVQLTTTLHDHITEDNARFDVLLNHQQKEELATIKTKRKSRGSNPPIKY